MNTARLNRGLRSAVQQKGGVVTLRLTPPELGTVRIQMQLTGTRVNATLHAETSAGHQALSSDLARLRTGLEAQGLSVDRLSVQPMTQNTASSQTDDNLNRDARDPPAATTAGTPAATQRTVRQHPALQQPRERTGTGSLTHSHRRTPCPQQASAAPPPQQQPAPAASAR
ncbi:flagellar hook-length control protein FliK [Mucisphaera calidilacus]|uniref:flagellar hook-length control protein FliK n=1 Tax=Mucisphaera calidilacus TaxID=2527982 RepID=UPI0011A98B13